MGNPTMGKNMDKKPTIVDLPSKDPYAASREELKRNLPGIVEHMAGIAKIKRSYYLGLISEGFTPEQALVIICHPSTV